MKENIRVFTLTEGDLEKQMTRSLEWLNAHNKEYHPEAETNVISTSVIPKAYMVGSTYAEVVEFLFVVTYRLEVHV